MRSTRLPVLWHLKVSNYNEKARWALDYKGLPHVRRAVEAGRHRGVARKLAGGNTLPVLELDGKAIGDSTEIIAELERRRPDPPLYPADPAERRRALDLEDFFDEELGPYVRLLAVSQALKDRDLMRRMFVPDLPLSRRPIARLLWPLVKKRVTADFGIDEESVEHAYQKIRAAGQRFRGERESSGYLSGDTFTVADLTLAAIVAPAVAPEQFPYTQPQRGHELFAPLRETLGEAGILDFALEMYARHRGVSAEAAP
jgi:glutathione S-transferase